MNAGYLLDLRFFEIYRSAEYLELLAQGALTSVLLAVGGGVVGLLLATLLASLRYSAVPVLAQLSTCYVEFIRNTPLIVQLFIVAFGLPTLIGYRWEFWAHALLALTLNFSAYFSEILRAGFLAIPDGQKEAASALGISSTVSFWKITFPQAVANMSPALNSQYIFLFLTTGVIAEIGVEDLTSAGLFIDSRTFRTFEVFIVLTGLYIAIALSFKLILTALGRWLFQWRAFV